MIVDKDLRQIANDIGYSFTRVKKSFNKTGIPITIKRCSVDHLIIKEIIEKLLSDTTVTEKTLKIEDDWYSINEYYKKLNIAFEIDGEWCHNKEKDILRDNVFQSIGVKTIRIPSNYREKEIVKLFKEYNLLD